MEKHMKNKHWITVVVLFFSITLQSCLQPERIVASSGPNQAPKIVKLSAAKQEVKLGEFTSISIEAVEPEGEELTYEWKASLGDILGHGSVVRYTAAFCCVGTNSITVKVTDAGGASTSKSISIEIHS